MRVTAFILAATFMLAAGAASACPMHNATAGNDQTVASNSKAPQSTPIPKSQQGG